MAPTFGTSGLRGLVTDLTDDLVARHVRAFLRVCPQGDRLFVGRDLRPSSPRIARAVMHAAQAAGLDVVPCGAVPTPALAEAAMAAGAGAVMVTGSHIPADRNGLKFYVPGGEITKTDETRILAALAAPTPDTAAEGRELSAPDLETRFVRRYADAFAPDALAGLRIGVYRHSSVARDLLGRALTQLGAEVVELGHSGTFIPVDTEAVEPETRQTLAEWTAAHGLNAIASTDGDGDRPMLTDASGRLVPGDVLGVLTARHLGARVIVTPVSSNDMVRRMGFERVILTRIGSPHVIAGMEEAVAADPAARVAGFEANGGFLLGFAAHPAGPLAPLMTRDSLLPILAPLVAARAAGVDLAALVAALPPCFTAADRLTGIDRDRAAGFLQRLKADPSALLGAGPPVESLDRTDGLRMNLVDGTVLHLRPSGNAPEFRIYVQAASPDAAQGMLARYRPAIAAALD
ncbi:phosphomannomutase [Falsirhodobacter algicola]|uniref:Phosphomannomutase n=1 Tax=Falsirhodobacter algicola TaxID=2692330 RepID=A0A8J8SM57_9RHOB|nr:phosphomannomutase [Falsirhodobacter algicola]QUS37061.1 phosphomannomutase [Falsirhodobacter algicola]